MKYFLDNTKVTLADLESRGIYSEELIENLKIGKIEKIMELDEDKREDREYMEPILYAMVEKYPKDGYKVYKYFTDKVKYQLSTDEKLSKEIITSDPKLIEDSPIAENKELILEVKDTMLEVIQYVSPKLDNDVDFLDRLCDSNNPKVISEAIEKYSVEKLIESDQELKSDEHFMTIAISQDITALEHADENILNSYDVFKEASQNSQEVIDFAIDNSEKLGIEAIEGVRDTVKENTDKDYMEVISKEAEKGTSERTKWVKTAIENHGKDYAGTLNVMIGTAAKSEEIDPGLINQAMDYAFLSKIRLEKAMEEDKDYQISFEEYKSLIRPASLNRLIEKAKIEMSPELQQDWEEYGKFYEEIREKRKELIKEKSQDKKENEKQDESKSKEDKLRAEISGHSSPEDYEKAAKAWEEMKASRDNDNVHGVSLEK